jgi:uncharacterized membrane protein
MRYLSSSCIISTAKITFFIHKGHKGHEFKKVFVYFVSFVDIFLYLCSQMQKSDKITNIILALVALGLLALCIASVVR